MNGAQRRERLAGVAEPEAFGAVRADVVEQRGGQQELALLGLELGQDLRREVLVQGIGLPRLADQILGRPPALEHDPGHPAGRRGP